MTLHRIKTKTLIMLFVGEAIYSFGQQGLSFKVYQNTDIFQLHCITVNPREDIKQTKVNVSRISLAAVLLSKKNYFHEIEFQIPESSKSLEKFDFPLTYTLWKGGSFDQAGSSFSFRYELGKRMGDHAKPLHFLFSAGINPYYAKVEYTPTTTTAPYHSREYYGFALNATPRLYYKLSRHFTIDLNLPIRIYDFQKAKYRQDNPILPAQQQRYTETNHLFFEPVYTLRLGLMYSLAKY